MVIAFTQGWRECIPDVVNVLNSGEVKVSVTCEHVEMFEPWIIENVEFSGAPRGGRQGDLATPKEKGEKRLM